MRFKTAAAVAMMRYLWTVAPPRGGDAGNWPLLPGNIHDGNTARLGISEYLGSRGGEVARLNVHAL